MKTRSIVATVLASALAFALAGCSSPAPTAASSDASGAATDTQKVRVGTMPTEDILPLWVAEQENLFAENGIEAEVVAFDSAPALSAAITAGQVDMAMTDIMRAVKLSEAGTPVTLEWITLGATPEQGRFGVQVAADSPYQSLADLAAAGATADVTENFGVGVAANTVPEYVLDKLCEQAGIDPASVPRVEVASLPERYGLMASGQLEGAALPGSLLALGEAQGMRTIADDSTGQNVSQSVMVARAAWAADNQAAIEAVGAAWDAAAERINADPEAFRAILVEKANLNSAVADNYPVSTYPMALSADGKVVRVPSALVDPILAWMEQKGYAEKAVSYDEETGAFAIA